ncbi:MAG: hypothetical protein ACHQ49_10075 [Elusimicrobiota bacterium]
MLWESEIISRWGVFEREDLELRYRRGQLPRDAALAVTFWQVIAAASAAFLVSESVFPGPSGGFAAVAVSRLSFAGLCLGAAFFLRRAATPRAFDGLMLASSLILAAYVASVTAASAFTYGGGLIVGILIVVSAYCVGPLPLKSQCVPALALSVGLLLAARRGGFSSSALSSAAIAFAMANGLGALASIELHRSKRELFLGAERQSLLRGELETAMTEVRTLRGIVPICAHCKKIRDAEGEWENIEDYVRHRTHAQFSHGVCPTCVELHYSDS